MKQLSSFLFLFLISILSQAQSHRQGYPRISAGTRQFLWQMEKGNADSHGALPSYVYQLDSQNQLFVNAFMQVFPNFQEESLKSLGIKTGTVAGNIRTVRIPVGKVKEALLIPGLRAIDMDQPMAMDLDSARRRTRVDSIHKGLGLSRAYNGDSVVIGIIDAGFDYSHPAFYDTSYSNYRVKRVWEQKVSGTPPANFPYGAEYSDSASIHAKAFDLTETTHGTHVGGIAGGSGYNGPTGNHNKFRGMAYKSDLVFVAMYPTPAYWLNTGMADMLDGINYTFQYGSSVGKPAVANLSWGCPLGPRDGTSLFSQACDNITGPGKIFVVSGGNNGQNKIHVKKTFTATDTLLNTFTTFSSSLNPKINQIDVWGDSGKTFQVQFTLYTTSAKIATSEWVTLDNSTHFIKLKGSNFDTLFVTATGTEVEFNGKPHMLLQFKSRVGDRVGITVKSTSGTVNLWQGVVVKTSGYYGAFTKYTYTWATDGDVNSTCGDLVSTKSALAVAAYNSKVSFTNILGSALAYTGYVRGRIAAFSSIGPTADGRVKPNIAGPGMALASSVSSYAHDYMPDSADYSSVVANFVSPKNNRTYAFAMAGGTSMSAPAVSGIVAMLLQVNPQLSPASIMDLLNQTAIKDNNTGVIPAGGSNVWGGGKINAYRAIKTLLEPTGIEHIQSSAQVLVFPNPGNGSMFAEYLSEGQDDVRIIISDAVGRVVADENWVISEGSNLRSLGMDRFENGLYYVRISGRTGTSLVKVLKN